MKVPPPSYFQVNPLKKDTRSSLIVLGILAAAALGVLVLQSFGYASSLPVLWETGQRIWGQSLSLMLQILVVWAFVLGVAFAVWHVTRPTMKYGSEFWEAVVTGFPLGLIAPFVRVLGFGLVLFLPLGLLSLLVPEVYPFATLQFTWLAAAYIVFLWIAVGMPFVLARLFGQRRWYYKFLAVLLALQLLLDVLQSLQTALKILLQNSVWQSNDLALLLALFGSLLVSSMVVGWSLRGQPALTIVYAIAGVYIASIVTGNFSERLFGWGEIPSAILALLSPLVYLPVAKRILRRDGTALHALAAAFAGLLTGLLLMQLIQLRITGQSWISLLYGIILVLGAGLALGYFLGRRLLRLLDRKLQLQPILLRAMDLGLTAGLMAGMLIGGFLAR